MSSTTYLKRIAEATEAGGQALGDTDNSTEIDNSITSVAEVVVAAGTTRVSVNFTHNGEDGDPAIWVSEFAVPVVGSRGVRVRPGGSYFADTKREVQAISEGAAVHISGTIIVTDS